MSWKPKYRIQYQDALGTQTVISIMQQNYLGLIGYLTGTESPLFISYPDPGDVFAPIRGSEARISFYSNNPYTYIELFTAGVGTYRIEVTKGGQNYWNGFIYPSVYQQTLGSSPYVIEITASDGLGNLKNHTFSNNILQPVFGNINLITAIRYCLLKTGLEPKIAAAVHLTHNASSGIFLQSTYINTSAFIDDDEFMSCYDVLTMILTAINARIYSFEGYFHIIRFDQYGKQYTIHYFNEIGQFTGSGNSYVVDLTSASTSDIRRLMNDALLSVSPPIKEITITNNYSAKEQLNIGNFSKIFWLNENNLVYWSRTNNWGTVNILPWYDGSDIDNYIGVQIYGGFDASTPSGTDRILKLSQTISLIRINQPFLFNISFELLSNKNGYIDFSIYLRRGSVYTWFNSSGGVESTYTPISILLESGIYKKFQLETIQYQDSPGFDEIGFAFSQLYYNAQGNSSDYVVVKDLKIVNALMRNLTNKTVTSINPGYEDNIDVALKIGLKNTPSEIKIIAPGILLNVVGAPITSIINEGTSYTNTSNLISNDYSNFYSNILERIEGTIYGYLLMNFSIIDYNHNNKCYYFHAITINDRECLNDVVMIETKTDTGDTTITKTSVGSTLPIRLAGPAFSTQLGQTLPLLLS